MFKFLNLNFEYYFFASNFAGIMMCLFCVVKSFWFVFPRSPLHSCPADEIDVADGDDGEVLGLHGGVGGVHLDLVKKNTGIP